ncbi:XrtA/PEP-CTERM system histidine kinase PrsK [Desulfomarina profundi]|uniref:XrtA/PEP-CTERM system histidine kinase PrsK n=1 Tax=Desulfomarina profundi TaxID=2772557 RepID=UPI001E54A72E|nr:XrtA/PEP-CTERM system histidine kinase PrsK [Desulfomarina profundi]
MVILYIINGLLFLSGFFTFFLKEPEKRFSRALVQALFALFLLSLEYAFLAYQWTGSFVQVVLVSEVIFAFIWFLMAFHLRDVIAGGFGKISTGFKTKPVIAAVATVAVCGFILCCSLFEVSSVEMSFQTFDPVYFAAIFILAVTLYVAWRLEQFWRRLEAAQRWEYKFFIVGAYLVCGSIAWVMSYRLTYLTILPDHLTLIAGLLSAGGVVMLYAIIHHRLLNRKIFVSRKVIYSFVVPSLLAGYFLGFGTVTLVMRTFGLEMSFVLKWLFLVLGGIGVTVFGLSGKIRSRIHFFISTHFYINKYEYRDEWLALSEQLQGALTEDGVVRALRRVLSASLYTTKIYIWLGDRSKGYSLVSYPENFTGRKKDNFLQPDDPLIEYISVHPYFHGGEKNKSNALKNVLKEKEQFLSSFDLILVAPVSIGSQLPGLIGLGPEYTGGRYGYDDFDLLTALGSQTASALLAVRMAEQLAGARERQAWDRLSAFVLHDIKNAATMLSLLQENAVDHIHEPEFQRDMLESVDDALRRMARVEERLNTLKNEIVVDWQVIDLRHFLEDCCRRLQSKLATMAISIDIKENLQVKGDPSLLTSIIENILINAYQARENNLAVRMVAVQESSTKKIVITILDNGPGILEALLPDALFEPFKTTKKGGSGIGLWQVKKMVEKLEGTITAGNRKNGGARFRLKLNAAG